MMRYFSTTMVILGLFLTGCNSSDAKSSFESDPAKYVDPIIGTHDMGHCYPGATVPFGMVQLSPDTDIQPYSLGRGYNPKAYAYCAGYQYHDNTIVGFSHTHFSGTGHADLGDLLIMPTVGPIQLEPGTKEEPESGYRSRFSHDTETASPGYYSVHLDDYNIDVELTATERVGVHKVTFPKGADAHIILDMTAGIYNYDDKVVWSSVRVENENLITGFLQTNGWARTRYVYFAMAFSQPISSYGLKNDERETYNGWWGKFNQNENFPERTGKKLKCHFNFDTENNPEVLIKVALSPVSAQGALNNLQAEMPGWDFAKTVADARNKWNRELSKIQVSGTKDRMISFYTSLYHSFLSPIIYADVDGQYRGLDQNIHQPTDFTNYTIFSLWDTYRALHPLFTIVQQKRTSDMVNSLLAHYKQSVHKILPIWSHYANENWCMIGYHAVPVIVDAYMKGIGGFDVDTAFEAVVSSATYGPYDGIAAYEKYGYVPEDKNGSSASKTLEYAYDDWTIAQFAEKLGKQDAAKEFTKRANSYKNIFDPETGFIRAKMSNGSFKTPFDAMSTHGQGYIEGNAWNYSLYVPHDPKGFIKLLGGNEKLVTWLDTLFTMEVSDEDIAGSEDVTRVGMIGNYVHGNEPSHHVPYLYCYAGQPWKTQERVHQIVNTMYKPTYDGLCGNDDCGQMSAWYIFSCLGFYPVAPGSNQYVIGSPCVDKAMINLENNKHFSVEAKNLSAENIYIQSATLNGKPLERCYLWHNEIAKGGKLVFNMGPTANKNWAVSEGERPYSMTK